jgi:hypothetical protein
MMEKAERKPEPRPPLLAIHTPAILFQLYCIPLPLHMQIRFGKVAYASLSPYKDERASERERTTSNICAGTKI